MLALVGICVAGSYFLQLRVGSCCTKSKAIKVNRSSTEQEISLKDELHM